MASVVSSLVQALDAGARASLVHSLQDKIINTTYDGSQTPKVVEALAETVAHMASKDWIVCI